MFLSRFGSKLILSVNSEIIGEYISEFLTKFIETLS